VRSSSEAEPRSRRGSALNRDGTSLEGASSPRARRNPARGGDQPSIEDRAPRAKRSSAARGWLGRLSGGPWARGFILRAFSGSFAFVFYEGKRVSLVV
jgi:hypothetical protein